MAGFTTASIVEVPASAEGVAAEVAASSEDITAFAEEVTKRVSFSTRLTNLVLNYLTGITGLHSLRMRLQRHPGPILWLKLHQPQLYHRSRLRVRRWDWQNLRLRRQVLLPTVQQAFLLSSRERIDLS